MPRAPRNIVVCCDGTGNRYGYDNSNVVKLYTCIDENADQTAYYHPGVGTMGDPRKASWLGKKLSLVGGLAFGLGFTDNLGDAYRFLMDTYSDGDDDHDGDHIYLFGFSRGAYTVRALAGAILMYGLLCPGNEGHLPYLLDMFSQESRDAYDRDYEKGKVKKLGETKISKGFRDTFSRVVPIHFMGVWDTVSSVGGLYDPVKLLFDGQNPIVRRARHAVSVDERRCFFQANLLGKPLSPPDTPVLMKKYPNPVDHTQNIVQAWFSGVHSDVGGSYDQSECAPAMDALKWMLEEAAADGLLINPDKCHAILGLGSAKYPDLAEMNPAPKPMNVLHSSLTWKWAPLEAFPHKYYDQNGKKAWRFTPWPHSREIPDGAILHPSLRRRLAEDKEYKPQNLDVGKVEDFAQSPVALPQTDVIQKLRDEGYGVYRPDAVPASSRLAPAAGVAAAVLVGLAAWLLHR